MKDKFHKFQFEVCPYLAIPVFFIGFIIAAVIAP